MLWRFLLQIDTLGPTPDTAIHTAIAAMAREVEAAQAKMVGHMENVLAEARDVEQPAAPVAEEKVQDPKDKSGPPKSRRRVSGELGILPHIVPAFGR